MHEKKFLKITFYWGCGDIQESVTEVFKLCERRNLSEKFTRPDFSKLLSDPFSSGRNWEHLTRRMARSDSYHLVDMYLNMKIKRYIPWWCHLGESPARVHLHQSFLLSLSLSLLRAVVSHFLCWEICRNVLFTVLKPVILFSLLSFFPSSDILVFAVVFLCAFAKLCLQ